MTGLERPIGGILRLLIGEIERTKTHDGHFDAVIEQDSTLRQIKRIGGYDAGRGAFCFRRSKHHRSQNAVRGERGGAHSSALEELAAGDSLVFLHDQILLSGPKRIISFIFAIHLLRFI